MRPPAAFLWTPEGSFYPFSLRCGWFLNLALDPAGPSLTCWLLPQVPRWNLSDASAPGESHCPRADGWSRHLVMVHRTVWGDYFCPGFSLHLGKSIYNVEISKQVSSCWPSASTPLMTSQCTPHCVRGRTPSFRPWCWHSSLPRTFPSLPDILGDSKFHAQFNSLLASQSIDISRLCPRGGGVSYFTL